MSTTVVVETALGKLECGESLAALRALEPASVDLFITSPPFALVREKAYGNVAAGAWIEWFMPFAEAMKDAMRESASLVIDIGGTWTPGAPARALYHLALPIALVEQAGLVLAQEWYWWNTAKLPSPAEWTTVRKLRAKDAVNPVWWMARTPWPKANVDRVRTPYSKSMLRLIETGLREEQHHPSGHTVGPGMAVDRGGSIPPNLIAIANTDSAGPYLRYCRERAIEPHPARFPEGLPEHFIRMLTDEGDLVVDPFAGSATTGAVAERLARRWLCIERDPGYCEGAKGRFTEPVQAPLPGMESALDPTGGRCR